MSDLRVVEKKVDDFNLDRLVKFKLPVIKNVEQLLSILEFTAEDEKNYFYSDNRRKYLYKKYYTKKKNGGERLIEAPDYRIKCIQKSINDVILSKFKMSKSCNGFVRDRSIFTNAVPHVGSKTVLKFDIKDFFPSIKLKQVVRQFRYFGYGHNVSRYLGYLCVNAEYSLPQGAPTSPMLSNLICVRLDKRIEGYCKASNLKYTRYADDITISSETYLEYSKCNKIKHMIYEIIKDEGFLPNEEKTHFFHNGQKLCITGLVVNDIVNVDKKVYREIENAIRYIGKYGLLDHISRIEYKEKIDYVSHIFGLISFVNLVNPTRARSYFQSIQKLIETGMIPKPIEKIVEYPIKVEVEDM